MSAAYAHICGGDGQRQVHLSACWPRHGARPPRPARSPAVPACRPSPLHYPARDAPAHGLADLQSAWTLSASLSMAGFVHARRGSCLQYGIYSTSQACMSSGVDTSRDLSSFNLFLSQALQLRTHRLALHICRTPAKNI